MTNAPSKEPTSAPKISIWSLLLTGAFGLIGVVLGGFLQYYLSGSLETQKQRQQIQISAYADFAKAQGALHGADDVKEIRDAAHKIQEASFRIVIFSQPEVVRALAAFVQQNHNINNIKECDTFQADIALYRILRRQMISDEDVSNQDIAMALFGCKLK